MDKKKIKLYIILLVLLIGASIMLPYAVNAVSDAIVGRITKHSETETDIETEEELLTELDAVSESTEESENDSDSGETVTLSMETDAETGAKETVVNAESSEVSGDEQDASESNLAADEAAGVQSDSANQAAAQESSEAKSEEADTAQSERLDAMEAYVSSFHPEIIVSDAAAVDYPDFSAGGEESFLAAVGEYIYSVYDDLVSIEKIEVIETVRNNDSECSCQIELFTADGSSELFICSYNKKWDYYGVYSMYSVE
ncbi:MAG: hypothetical protein LUG93_13740 [Lachnospiraceae bacterium]|nr:hypothetical protein [Lachnospiraceae bacterium]